MNAHQKRFRWAARLGITVSAVTAVAGFLAVRAGVGALPASTPFAVSTALLATASFAVGMVAGSVGYLTARWWWRRGTRGGAGS